MSKLIWEFFEEKKLIGSILIGLVCVGIHSEENMECMVKETRYGGNLKRGIQGGIKEQGFIERRDKCSLKRGSFP